MKGGRDILLRVFINHSKYFSHFNSNHEGCNQDVQYLHYW